MDLLGLTWVEAMDPTRDRSEWRDCTARCAFTARGRTKVYKVRSHFVGRGLISWLTRQYLYCWVVAFWHRRKSVGVELALTDEVDDTPEIFGNRYKSQP